MTKREAAGGAGTGARQADGAADGLVGRGDVLARLGRAVDDAVAGHGGLVLLTGEAGIGKTTVAARAAAEAERRGVLAVWGWGWQGEGAPAYWPWGQVLRSLAARDGRLLRQAAEAPSLARLLPELPGAAATPPPAEAPPAAARFQLFDELSSALLVAAEERPLAVILDDLQWADLPSVRLLDFLTRRLPPARMLVIGTYRDADRPPDDPAAALLAELAVRGTVLPLAGLSEEEVAQVVAGILGAAPAPALVAAVRRRTGGNPFFVQQVTRLLLAQSGSPDRLQAAGETAIPFGVREAVERHLARLRPPCAEVVTAAAVVGPEFGPALLARVTGRPAGAVRDLLDEAVRAQVLAAPAGPLQPYRFAHDLFRESIDERLGTEARARLHRQIGEALEAERDAAGGVPLAQLANHFARAGAGAEDAAVRYATLAAAEATQRLAHAEAAQHLARALEALDGSAQPQGPRRVELLLELAAAHRRAGDLAASRRACRRAAELARRAADANGLARAALSLHAIGSRSWPSLAGELLLALEEASVALGEQDTPLRARVLASLARELAWNGTDVARAARLADAAVATAQRAGDRATLAACLLARHNAVWGPGNAAERLALATQVTELAEELGDPELAAEARLLRVSDLLELADPAFQAELAEFLRVAAALRQPRWRHAALSRRAMLALLAGRLDEVEPLVQEAAALAREIDEPDAADVEFTQLWELRGEQGRRGELLERLRALLPDDMPPRRYFEAMTLLEQGDRKGAEQAAGPLQDLLDITALPADRNWLPAASFAAELAAALEVRPAYERLYQALAPYAAGAVVVGAAITFRGSVAYYLGLLATVLDRPEEAAGHFRHASEVHQRLGARAWEPPTRHQVGAPATGGTFRRDGALWTLAYAGREVRMRDAKGLRDLATLLRAPGRPVHVADLLAGRADEEAVAADLRLGADEVLDDRARREIRARLLELEDETEEANRWHDAERAARATLERDALLREVAAAAGLGGRARRLGDQSERARKTVTARIRHLIDRVERAHPALGAHLRASVTTGTSCTYSPPSPTTWEL